MGNGLRATAQATGAVRTNWVQAEVEALFELPFNDLLHEAHCIHRKHFDPNQVQVSTLLSIKTGACPEDCAYCPQSVRFDTGVELESLLPIEQVLNAARTAKENGATRFCMGAAYRNPKPKQLKQVAEMVTAVKALGLETCATLGMLDKDQAQSLKSAGLDYYNHNLDTSPEYYKQIITTRTYEARLDTLEEVRQAGLKVCCGGIIGMGEERVDRVRMLLTLATLPEHPGSVPINQLVRVKGTPLYDSKGISPLEFVRTIAVARIMMPESYVRLSAGRTDMNAETQALCFHAGANSIFFGDKLLTTPNPEEHEDFDLMNELGIQPESISMEAPGASNS